MCKLKGQRKGLALFYFSRNCAAHFINKILPTYFSRICLRKTCSHPNLFLSEFLQNASHVPLTNALLLRLR